MVSGWAAIASRASKACRRLYEHLEPGGLLLLDNEVPYAVSGIWPLWQKDERQALPKPWLELGNGDRRQGSDGAEYELRSRVVELDPVTQCVTLEMRADMWVDGEHVAAEEHVLRMSMYFTHELVSLLELAGFTDVTLRGDYTDEEPSPDTEFVVFIARKPPNRVEWLAVRSHTRPPVVGDCKHRDRQSRAVCLRLFPVRGSAQGSGAGPGARSRRVREPTRTRCVSHKVAGKRLG